MIFFLSLHLTFIGCSVASALSLSLTSPTNLQQALNTTNASALSKNLQLGDNVTDLTIEAHCDGAETGVDLTKANCQDAVSFGIPNVTKKDIIDYGDRKRGNFDVNVPQRYISGDGRCVIDVSLEYMSKKTPYYPFGIALAATFLQEKCVEVHNPPQGGTLEGFDENHNMHVVLKSYQPKVVCVGQTVAPDIRTSCQSILDSMILDEAPLTFGVTRDSTVRTPYSRVSADRLCVMEIATSGVVSDVANWRDFWEVGVALNGVCIRKGMEGFQINLGAAGGLHMELKDNRNLGGTISSS